MQGAAPLAYLPSPSQSVWHLGPLPVRAYALCIVAGIVVALWLTARRFRERGGTSEDVWDVAGWAIVLGIIGGRLYHVVTDPELYFAAGKHPIDAVKIWDGGLGIWGAIALGTLGAWIGCRRKGLRLTVFADAAVPGVIFAQALGRFGNWFNNELYGSATSHAVEAADPLPRHRRRQGTDLPRAPTARCSAYFQPTFLYEVLWDVALGVALILIDRRLRLGRGNVMALYVMGYTVGRVWIEALRTDHANTILGPAAQHLDLHRRVRRRAGLLPAPRRLPGAARGHAVRAGARRRAAAGRRSAGRGRSRSRVSRCAVARTTDPSAPDAPPRRARRSTTSTATSAAAGCVRRCSG